MGSGPRALGVTSYRRPTGMRLTREQIIAERDLARADIRRLTAAVAARELEIARLKNEIARLVAERGDLISGDERDRG